MDRFWLSEEQFAKIAPHLPTDRGVRSGWDCRVISCIVHTCGNRFRRWAKIGVWDRICSC